jgi:hypothetical protein
MFLRSAAPAFLCAMLDFVDVEKVFIVREKAGPTAAERSHRLAGKLGGILLHFRSFSRNP